MIPTLVRYLNQTVFVSIPALFEDANVRPYMLLGVEPSGLWLQSPLLADRLLGDKDHQLAPLAPAVFVPFAQIAGVIFATRMPEASSPEAKTHAAAKSPKRAAPTNRRR